jgi:hypothetical protein
MRLRGKGMPALRGGGSATCSSNWPSKRRCHPRLQPKIAGDMRATLRDQGQILGVGPFMDQRIADQHDTALVQQRGDADRTVLRRASNTLPIRSSTWADFRVAPVTSASP